MDNIKNYVIEI